MPPKKSDISEAIEDLANKMSKQFADLDTKINSFVTKMDSALAANAATDKKVRQLNLEVNHLGQRERGKNIRITGLKLSNPKSALSTSLDVYNALLPIIKQAINDEECQIAVPSFLDTIDYCHKLPTKDENEIPPLHCRLRSKLVRELIFIHKGKYFKSTHQKFSIMEDLTPQNRILLRATKDRADVERAWVRNGVIKYRLKANPDVVHTAKIA